MLRAENRNRGGKVAWYRDIVTSFCSDQLAIERTESCTHKGLANTGLPKARAQDPVQPWIPLVCKLFTIVQNKGVGPVASGRSGICSREKLPTSAARLPPGPAKTARAEEAAATVGLSASSPSTGARPRVSLQLQALKTGRLRTNYNLALLQV